MWYFIQELIYYGDAVAQYQILLRPKLFLNWPTQKS